MDEDELRDLLEPRTVGERIRQLERGQAHQLIFTLLVAGVLVIVVRALARKGVLAPGDLVADG